VLVLLVVVLVGFDLCRPPDRQLAARVLLTGIRAYQSVGHHLVPAGHCRFSPTCSRYAVTVVERHGALRGGWLILSRLVRCGPWTPAGTEDPPPK
jgi:putative membrane protein insertion efficiency factor